MNNGMGDGRIINYLLEIRAFHDRLEAGGLSAQAIALWYALMHIANKTGWKDEFSAAASALSLHAGLSASGVKRAREALRSAGLIEWKARGGNRASLYRLKSCAVRYGARDERELGNGMRAGFRDGPWDTEADGGAPDGGLMAGSWAEPQPGRKRAPRDGLRYGPHDGSEGGGKSGEPSGPRNGPQSGCVPKQDREKQRKHQPPLSPAGERTGEDDGFEDFWKAYPRKAGKEAARRAWERLRPDGAMRETLGRAVEAHAQSEQWIKQGGQYIPYPGTWLSQRRWEDELPRATAAYAPIRVIEHQYSQRIYDPAEVDGIPPEQMAAVQALIERERNGEAG